MSELRRPKKCSEQFVNRSTSRTRAAEGQQQKNIELKTFVAPFYSVGGAQFDDGKWLMGRLGCQVAAVCKDAIHLRSH